MTPVERSEGESEAPDPAKPTEGLVIIATPFDGEQPQEKHFPDGGFTIYLRGEIHVAYQPPASETAKSPVTVSEEQRSSLTPESTSQPVTEPHSAGDVPSWEKSRAEGEDIPESENRKFVLVGNP